MPLVKATHEAGIKVVTIPDALKVRQKDEVCTPLIKHRELAKLTLHMKKKMQLLPSYVSYLLYSKAGRF